MSKPESRNGSSAVSRRTFLKSSLAVGVVSGVTQAFSSRTFGAAREEIVMVTYGGAYQNFFSGAFKEAFEKRYPCTLVVQAMGVPEKSAKLLAEKDHPSLHVIMVEPKDAIAWNEWGILTRLTKDNVPNIKNVYKTAQDPYGFQTSVAHGFNCRALAYDTVNIKSEPTWEMMWDPKYRGKVGMISNASEEMGIQFLVVAAMLAGGDQRNIEPGWKKLREWKETMRPIFYANNAIRNQYQTKRELWMCLSTSTHTYALAQTGVQLKLAKPKGKSFLGGSAIVIPKNLPTSKMEFALKCADMMLEPEWQIKSAEETFLNPSVKGVEVPKKLLEVLPTQEELDQLILLDWRYINTQADKWAERFRNEIQS
jgi:putative spermidine/putrescine transport system substrate-binding protein